MALSLSSFSEEIESISEKSLRRHDSRNQTKLKADVCFLPKENEEKPYGEDAFFISCDEQTIGVADGVGGWADSGIDSGVYARELMSNASRFVENRHFIDPMAVLNHAFVKSKAAGSSTACVITLRDSILHAVNVGDSGFRVIRSGKVVYSSPVQQSYFNCPFQLGACPLYGGNSPSDADEIEFEVKPGDVIVAATDGLFDNMFDDELEWLVEKSLYNGASPGSMAGSVGRMARKASLYGDEASPFTVAARKAGLDWDSYLGGKYDDVTVIVGYIY